MCNLWLYEPYTNDEEDYDSIELFCPLFSCLSPTNPKTEGIQPRLSYVKSVSLLKLSPVFSYLINKAAFGWTPLLINVAIKVKAFLVVSSHMCDVLPKMSCLASYLDTYR